MRNEYTPITASAIANKTTTSGLLSAHSMSFRSMNRLSLHQDESTCVVLLFQINEPQTLVIENPRLGCSVAVKIVRTALVSPVMFHTIRVSIDAPVLFFVQDRVFH